MLIYLIKFFGWTIAHVPEAWLHALSKGLGDLIYWLLPKRRRIVLSNLHHAFPERDESWRRWVARQSSRRMIETGLLACAIPFLSERRLLTILSCGSELHSILEAHARNPDPTLICTAHLAYWEALPILPFALRRMPSELGVIYRPLKSVALNNWVKRSRERFGARLLSRRDGMSEAMKILRRRNFVGLLFDQNAGDKGALATFLGRICSTSELPGLWTEKFSANVVIAYPRRLGFWRAEVHADMLPKNTDSKFVTLALNQWLETKLESDDDLCASWLWMHNRWRTQNRPDIRLRLEAKRNLLDAEMSFRGWRRLPRKTRIVVRLPNWLGDVVMLIPLLRALRISRPDAELTLIGKAVFQTVAEAAGVADHYESLPARGPAYWRHFHHLRFRHPDVYLLFTNSFRGDLEAWLTRTPQRFGIKRPGKLRFGLTNQYRIPRGCDESQQHQLELWENYLRHFGLNAAPDRAPLAAATPRESGRIGLIAGSENFPGKRWPVQHWRALIEAMPDQSFVLFGTSADRSITDQIAEGYSTQRVENLAGKTNMEQFMNRLGGCRLLVSNDTGGMHLANAMGVPVIGLFGPTNPVRTGPVFNSPVQILQPPGCPRTGGGSLTDLLPATVVAGIRNIVGGTIP
ncbi:MAG: hypothetical protein K1X42_06490 [Opitutaceae bacterium]|nr:hypothetical protein [Opitutaceae bacterium]